MKIKENILLFILVLTCLAMVGCESETNNGSGEINPPSAKVEQTNESQGTGNKEEQTKEETKQSDDSRELEINDEIKQIAKEEGISDQEMLDILKELIGDEATARHITVSEYLKQIDDAGSTPVQTVKEVVDQINMTIVEYYEMVEGIQVANIDGELSEADIPSSYPIVELPLLAVEKLDLISGDETEAYVSYYSEKSYDEIKKHYEDILATTENFNVKDYEEAYILKGTIAGKNIKVEISDSRMINVIVR